MPLRVRVPGLVYARVLYARRRYMFRRQVTVGELLGAHVGPGRNIAGCRRGRRGGGIAGGYIVLMQVQMQVAPFLSAGDCVLRNARNSRGTVCQFTPPIDSSLSAAVI